MEEAARASPRPRIPATNVVMFAVTVVTTLWTGFNLSGVEVPSPWGAPVAEAARRLFLVALAGAPFAGSLMAILFAHEMGHYLLARRHRVDATLPYFIPFVPWFLGGIGTLGAVIRLRSPTPSRTAALEIGAAGPLFGFVVAVPILLWGYAHSQLVTVGAEPGLQSPLAWALERLGLLAAGPELSNGPVLGESLLTTLALRLTHGPLPAGTDLQLHPVGFAAWFGLYVTTINLLPIGQLDGGHVLYGVLGRSRALFTSRLFSWSLLLLGITCSFTWLVWWGLTRFVLGVRHPPVLEEAPPLTLRGRALALLSLAVLVLTFAPFPFRAG
jgi:membrane-associated protease RseP (regulator of RpoE activity)